MTGVEVFGTAAAAAQLSQAVLGIVQEILRAAKDIRVAPEKTKDLLNQVGLVDVLLNGVWEKQKCIPTYLEPVLGKLKVTLGDVKAKVDKYVAKDKQRERESKLLRLSKNLAHQGDTKQKKKVRELSIELQAGLKALMDAVTVDTCNRVIEIPQAIEKVNENLHIVLDSRVEQSEHNTKMIFTQDQIRVTLESISRKLDRDHEEHNFDAAKQFPEKIENKMVVQLTEAADADLDNDSFSVQLESQSGPGKPWQVLYSEYAGADPGAAVADVEEEEEEEEERRASVPGGYAVEDASSLRFTMSVNEKRFFLFLTYAHVPGAELKVYYPTKADMNHEIRKQDSRVLFPDRQNKSFRRGPPRYEVRKQGSSRKSKESIFVVYSRNTLVRADDRSSKKNLDITDVADELQKHLENKLGKEGCHYREIIVKHLMIDIFATS